jgi:hypothetical protein
MTGGHETGLPVIETLIRKNGMRAIEYFGRRGEIEAALPFGPRAFGGFERDLHLFNVPPINCNVEPCSGPSTFPRLTLVIGML